MAAIKFDGTLNIPTLVSIIVGLVTGVTFIVGIRGDVKTHTAQIAELTQQVGELRRIQMHVSSRQDNQEKAVSETGKKINSIVKVAKSNKIQIDKNTAFIKKLPEVVTMAEPDKSS
jgi:hypothetical protein